MSELHRDPGVSEPPVTTTRSLHLTDERLLAYSRRGNYHSDPEAAAGLGFTGLVAQGMQVAGPAYGLLLDAWGEAFLAHGELDVRFVGMVFGGDTVDATVTVDEPAAAATLEVAVRGGDRVAVVGTARRPPQPDRTPAVDGGVGISP